ncbi:MAG: hypothetical protein PVH77_11525, partial [Phycisphaerales bacterium]
SNVSSMLGGVQPETPYTNYSNFSSALSGVQPETPYTSYSGLSSALLSALSGVQPETPKVKKVDIATGQSKFEIHWSVNFTQNKKLNYPRIEEIKFVSTKWEEG